MQFVQPFCVTSACDKLVTVHKQIKMEHIVVQTVVSHL